MCPKQLYVVVVVVVVVVVALLLFPVVRGEAGTDTSR